MFSVVVHLVELVSNHMLRWIGLKLVTMWIAQKCISVNARIHIQSGLKLVGNCSVNRPLRIQTLKRVMCVILHAVPGSKVSMDNLFAAKYFIPSAMLMHISSITGRGRFYRKGHDL